MVLNSNGASNFPRTLRQLVGSLDEKSCVAAFGATIGYNDSFLTPESHHVSASRVDCARNVQVRTRAIPHPSMRATYIGDFSNTDSTIRVSEQCGKETTMEACSALRTDAPPKRPFCFGFNSKRCVLSASGRGLEQGRQECVQ